MVAGEQDLGHRPAAPLRGPRVVRVLGRALQRRGRRTPRSPTPRGRARPAACAAPRRRRPSPPARRRPARSGRSRSGRCRSGRRSARRSPRSARTAASARGSAASSEASASSSSRPPGRQRDHAPPLAQLDRVDAVAGAQRAPPSRRRAAPSRRRRRTACRRPAPPLSGVVARGVDALERVRRARARWRRGAGRGTSRTSRGNSVKTSTSHSTNPRSTSIRRAVEVDRADRVAHQRDQAASPDLERLAGGQRDHPPHHADLALAVDDAAAREVVRPELALLERRRLGLGHAQLGAAQRLGVLAARAAVEPQDRLLGACRRGAQTTRRSPSDAARRGRRAARRRRVPRGTTRRARAGGRRGRPAASVATRRCRRGRGGCP